MNYALIFDNNQYQFCKLLTTEKKHSVIQALENKIDKKIKNENLILSFSQDPSLFKDKITNLKENFDFELLWEISGDKDQWSWTELIELYFGEFNLINQLTIFLAICDPSIYFIYLGEQKFKRCAPEEVVMRKLQIQKQIEYQIKFDSLYATLFALQKPEWKIDPLSLINKPDKNSLEYKVTSKVCKDLKLTILELLFKIGYIESIEDLLITSFKKQYFPLGTELSPIEILSNDNNIPLNQRNKVFSIDDSLTTEIDDAFSVQYLPNDNMIVGIHISAPSLNRDLLSIASERLSTVYYPGHKITMLPENIIAYYSLDQGKILPVVSIYFTIDKEFNILHQESKLEQVMISDNLRTENLEQFFNAENLEQTHNYPYESELKLLHKFALQLEDKRGKSSVNQLMIDYNFLFDSGKISIKPRVRGNPIDKLVSELMILANCSWGRMLTNAFIPAIYRVKQPMQPVTMTLTPNSHTGLNVDYYTWATSPLRRAVDLVNQSQIISLLTKQKPLNTADFAVANVVENFDTTYSAYLKFQDSLERYWSLRYLEQENIKQIKATFTWRNNVQLDGVPIMLDVSTQTKAQPQGSEIILAIDNINFLTQSFDFKIIN